MTESRAQDRCLELSRHAALKTRAQGDVLVLPERAIRVGGSGGEILRLCDGESPSERIVERMRERYPDEEGIESEVLRFLDEMVELGGLVPVATRADGSESC